MRKFIIILLTAHCSLLTVHWCAAQIIHVRANQPTIQAGINAAADGDTVLVADGTYQENINFNGKAIMVASHFIMDTDTNHINNTVIDGSQPGNPDTTSVFTLVNGEDSTSVICGFTITGGTGMFVEEHDMMIGGGIATKNAGVKVLNNKIISNEINHSGYALGGGIGCLCDDAVKWLVARDNLIHHNHCYSDGIEALGAGVYTGTSLVFENNEVCDNTCICENNANANAAGIANGSPEHDVVFNFRDNYIHHNHCEGYQVTGVGVMLWKGEGSVSGNQIRENSGISVDGALGGGMLVSSINGVTTISANEFVGNSLEGEQVEGGGMNVNSANAPVNILNNTFEQNLADGSSLAHGGGLMIVQNHELLVSHNIFLGNVMQGGMFAGAGMEVSEPLALTEIRNNSFFSNTGSGTGFGGGCFLFNAFSFPLEIDGNIFENNNMNVGAGLYTHNCYSTVLSNNIFTGNNAAEIGGGFRLRHYSGKAGETALPEDIFFQKKDEPNDPPGRTTNHPLLINNTFYNNTSGQGGAIYCDHQDEFPLVMNSIFWENQAEMGDDIYYSGEDSLVVSYCIINSGSEANIFGKWKGNDNINENPGFLDGNCHIGGSSPCIDMGIDSLGFEGTWYYAPDHDYDGVPRPFGNGVDIGADEVDNAGIGQFEIKNSKLRIDVYPNPTSGMVDFRFSMVDSQWVSLRIYDLQGREVATVLEGRWYGDKVIRWDATGLPAGVYFYQLRAKGEGQGAVGKILKH